MKFIESFEKTAGGGALNPLDLAAVPFAGTDKAKESSKVRAEASAAQAADAKKARKHNLAQYLLNPHVPGPISEVGHRLMRRHHASKAESPYLTSLIPLFGEIRGGKAGEKELKKEAVSASMGDQLRAMQAAKKKAKNIKLLKGGLIGTGVLGAGAVAHHYKSKKQE